MVLVNHVFRIAPQNNFKHDPVYLSCLECWTVNPGVQVFSPHSRASGRASCPRSSPAARPSRVSGQTRDEGLSPVTPRLKPDGTRRRTSPRRGRPASCGTRRPSRCRPVTRPRPANWAPRSRPRADGFAARPRACLASTSCRHLVRGAVVARVRRMRPTNSWLSVVVPWLCRG